MADLTGWAELFELPKGFLSADARDLCQVLPTPTLIHLPGRRTPALFVSILLHGNETVGLRAVQSILARYAERPLPRALSVFVGNVRGAHAGLRRLDEQTDFNRVWPGGTLESLRSSEGVMAQQVFTRMAARHPFACIDLHNNTGLNPLYSCVTAPTSENLQLATLFGRTVIVFEQPVGTLVGAFGAICPSIAVECGRPGNVEGEARAAELIDAAMHWAEVPHHPPAPHDIDAFETIGVVTVRPEVSFAFSKDAAVDVRFDAAIDHCNFRELAVGTSFGVVASGVTMPLRVHDAHGRDVTREYFEVRNGVLMNTRPLMPAMLTTDERAIRQDCLCYVMARIEPSGRPGKLR